MDVERVEGIIMKGVGGLYTVRTAGFEKTRLPLDTDTIVCPARGKFRHENITPYPGDRVILVRDGNAWAIDEVLERKTSLRRPAVENVTHL